MKRFAIQYLILIATTVVVCVIAKTGYITLSILTMVVYATVLIWSSYRDQAERNLFNSLTYHHVKELIEDNQRLGEALIVVTAGTPWVSASLKTEQGEAYVIDLPGQDHLILYRLAKEEEGKGSKEG